jgi:hypothetical protein
MQRRYCVELEDVKTSEKILTDEVDAFGIEHAITVAMMDNGINNKARDKYKVIVCLAEAS